MINSIVKCDSVCSGSVYEHNCTKTQYRSQDRWEPFVRQPWVVQLLQTYSQLFSSEPDTTLVAPAPVPLQQQVGV